jgi:hypothetical protein
MRMSRHGPEAGDVEVFVGYSHANRNEQIGGL